MLAIIYSEEFTNIKFAENIKKSEIIQLEISTFTPISNTISEAASARITPVTFKENRTR